MRAALGVGANLGNRAGTLAQAVRELAGAGTVLAVSNFIETAPVGGPEGQGRFLNGAVVVDTVLTAHQLLGYCLELELRLGRDRGPDAVRWGPRRIDIDLLLYGNEMIEDVPSLIVPHPRMTERGFVLQPLAEIAPDWVHPACGMTIGTLWQKFRANVR